MLYNIGRKQVIAFVKKTTLDVMVCCRLLWPEGLWVIRDQACLGYNTGI